MIKLSILSCISRCGYYPQPGVGDGKKMFLMTSWDFERALHWLKSAELTMTDCFADVGLNNLAKPQRRLLYHLAQRGSMEWGEAQRLLFNEISPKDIKQMLSYLIEAEFITVTQEGGRHKLNVVERNLPHIIQQRVKALKKR